MYDLAIIGAGPAGMNASIYASRYGIKNIIIGEPGGLTTKTHEIGNWLGTEKISGFDFAQKAEAHVRSYGTELEYTIVKEIKGEAGNFQLTLENGKLVETKTLLIATGNQHRHLGVPGEKEFSGKGVSCCATCDGFFNRGKVVAIVGGNDSAVGAAVYMSDIASKVYVVYRKDKLRAESFWVENAKKNPKIEIVYNTEVKEILGSTKLEELRLSAQHEGSDKLKVDGLFIEIGFIPSTELIKNLGVETDEEGYIKIKADGSTTAAGIWAAGDITDGSNKFKQIVTAAAEGAIAARSIQKSLKK